MIRRNELMVVRSFTIFGPYNSEFLLMSVVADCLSSTAQTLTGLYRWINEANNLTPSEHWPC